jgi:hypothetical protein
MFTLPIGQFYNLRKELNLAIVKLNMTKTFYRFFLLLVLSISWSTHAMAQPDTPCPPDQELDDCDPDYPVPIDGGAGILVAAGVAYGLKKIYNKKNNSEQDQDEIA